MLICLFCLKLSFLTIFGKKGQIITEQITTDKELKSPKASFTPTSFWYLLKKSSLKRLFSLLVYMKSCWCSALFHPEGFWTFLFSKKPNLRNMELGREKVYHVLPCYFSFCAVINLLCWMCFCDENLTKKPFFVLFFRFWDLKIFNTVLDFACLLRKTKRGVILVQKW